jgi:hypothetical protein
MVNIGGQRISVDSKIIRDPNDLGVSFESYTDQDAKPLKRH